MHRTRNISASDLRQGTLAGVFSALSYATGVLWIRYAYDAGLTPGTAIFLRFAIASMALILLLKLSGRWTPLPFAQARALFSLGLLTYTFIGIGWFTALSLTPAWLVSLFLALLPFPVAIGSWLFLKERPDRQQVLALAFVLCGGVALFWRPIGGAALIGVLCMIGVILLHALYLLVGERWATYTQPMMTAVWTTLGAMVGTFCYAVLFQELRFQFTPVGWLWAILFGVLSTAVAIMLLWQSIAYVGPSRTSIIGALEPLTSIVLSVLVLGESMTMLQALGGLLILAGVLVVQMGPRRLSDGP